MTSGEELGPPSDAGALPLAGTRVLDVSGRGGAYCTKILADLGADVLKVELPGGDALRHGPPFHCDRNGEECGLLFSYYHHNKRGITLDWRREEALPLLAQLAGRSQVVVASPRGERDRLAGYRHEPPRVTWGEPDNVVCFITPFGLTGPYRDWRATPFTAFALSGRMYPVGPEEGPPVAMPGQQFYDVAGAWAAFLIATVLHGPPAWRAQTIDQSVHEVGLFYELGQPPFALTGQIKTRLTNFGAPPSGIWRCADRSIDIACHTDAHWEIFLDLVGRPEVLADPLYRDRAMRIQLFDLLTEVISGILLDRSARELVESGQVAGLPCALSLTPGQFVAEEQARARGFFVPSSPGDPGSPGLPGSPFRADPPLTSERRGAPRLGEANEEVYVGDLGHLRHELEEWQASGLV